MIKEADRILKKANLRGFGGDCGRVAIAINRVLFGGKGKYVVVTNPAFNKAFKTFFMGHVVVEWNGRLFDSSGLIEDEDTIETFGVIDEDDPDYDAAWKEAGFSKDPLTEDQKYGSESHYIDDVFGSQKDQEEAIISATKGSCSIKDAEKTLRSIKK